MHGGASVLTIIEAIAAAVFALLGIVTGAISVFYRKEIIRTEKQRARIKLGLEKNPTIGVPVAPVQTKQKDGQLQEA